MRGSSSYIIDQQLLWYRLRSQVAEIIIVIYYEEESKASMIRWD